MEVNCIFCGLPTPGRREENCLKCLECDVFSHFSCLARNIRIPDRTLRGDVFYKFTCKSCSPSKVEIVCKEKVSWLTALILALYNLQEHPHLSRHGYFHWKMHISDFIDRKWSSIFGSRVRRKRTWHGTVSGTLSHYSPAFFQTGSDVLKEPGWWKLTNSNISPFLAMKLKHDSNCSLSRKINVQGIAPEDTNIKTVTPTFSEPAVMLQGSFTKSADIDLDLFHYSDSESLDVDVDVDLSNDQNPFASVGFPHMDTSLSDLVDLCVSSEEIVPNICASLNNHNAQQDEACASDTDLDNSDNDIVYAPPARSLFVRSSRQPLPWIKQESACSSDQSNKRFTQMAEYNELKLLQRLSKYVEKNNLAVPQDIRRLYRKLCVRREQRHRRLTPFSDSLSSLSNLHGDRGSSLNHARTLDRYQVWQYQGINSLSCKSYSLRLIGKVEPTCFVSPYTERLLKPFIRRDYDCRPLRLCLLASIREKVNSSNPYWRQPKQHPIDYCYVQPQHIPSINSLCELFFWPGIDLSDSLHYPDFSCVALYRKLVIGFAFMVPDVSNNESYISFLCTHPEWRRAGIATFMLYHIIQTCMGKDIALHVSVTNPAIILYQKFGFKVEELALDFYDKYLPNDSKECRHALFLKLSR